MIFTSVYLSSPNQSYPKSFKRVASNGNLRKGLSRGEIFLTGDFESEERRGTGT